MAGFEWASTEFDALINSFHSWLYKDKFLLFSDVW